jgi:excisionase family DNA binding protein
MSDERSETMTTTPLAPARLLSAKEVAATLGVRPHRVRELVRDGQLRSIRLSEAGNHRFDPRDIERFLAGEEVP